MSFLYIAYNLSVRWGSVFKLIFEARETVHVNVKMNVGGLPEVGACLAVLLESIYNVQ